MVIIAFLILHWYLSLFCQTFFLHRYAAHGMYKLNKFWEKFFYLLTYITQGPSFLNPKAYSILHQRHHQYSDTKNDPHSPLNHKNFLEMMIKTLQEYQSCLNLKHVTDVKQLWPTWTIVDRFARTHFSIILWILIYLSIYVFYAESYWLFVFLPLHFLMGPIQGAIVNWCGHKIGYRNFNLPDESKNTFFIDVFLLGELYQNNHHRFSQKTNFAYKWYEWDPGHSIINLLVFFGVIKKAK